MKKATAFVKPTRQIVHNTNTLIVALIFTINVAKFTARIVKATSSVVSSYNGTCKKATTLVKPTRKIVI